MYESMTCLHVNCYVMILNVLISQLPGSDQQLGVDA